ncbi:hypothetical protein Srufu_080200 (plasmid) [Streptomyces libani subsp. rufus]|nr:hypothetical protein Srufu_080200 [Streptomyces libani subsp. rufus]
MSDRACTAVGALIGVTLGGVLTLAAARTAIDWAIARAIKAS